MDIVFPSSAPLLAFLISFERKEQLVLGWGKEKRNLLDSIKISISHFFCNRLSSVSLFTVCRKGVLYIYYKCLIPKTFSLWQVWYCKQQGYKAVTIPV